MQTQCTSEQLEFSSVGRRRVVAAFDGGQVSSDCGALLLKKTDEAIRLIDRLADCFIDQRSQSSVEHSVRTLVAQRVFGIAAGYEDLNDTLRSDPLWGVVLGKLEAKRRGCAPLAGRPRDACALAFVPFLVRKHPKMERMLAFGQPRVFPSASAPLDAVSARRGTVK